MKARRLVSFSVVSVLSSFGSCAPPQQNGGVIVRSGAAERIQTLCRWRHGDVKGEFCAAPDEPAPPRVRRIAAGSDKLRGPLAIGRVGDYVIENDEVVFVVDQLGRGSGFAESGGN